MCNSFVVFLSNHEFPFRTILSALKGPPAMISLLVTEGLTPHQARHLHVRDPAIQSALLDPIGLLTVASFHCM